MSAPPFLTGAFVFLVLTAGRPGAFAQGTEPHEHAGRERPAVERVSGRSVEGTDRSVGREAGQRGTDSTRHSPGSPFALRTTLDAWRESRRLLLLDRAHSVGGRFFDRGLFRHVTPGVDREYDQEMLAYGFPPGSAREGRPADNRLLFWGGSIRRDLWAFSTRLRSRVSLGRRHALDLRLDLQEDGQVSRALLDIGYAWRPAPGHAVGLRHTLSQYKYDFDVSAFYRARSSRFGVAEVEWTFQNLYSDLIYQSLGLSASDRDVIRDYARHPYLLTVSYASPDRFPLRGELVGGIQPLSEAVFEAQSNSAFRYRDDRRAHFVGALLEYRVRSVAGGSLTGGLFYKTDVSWLRRTGTGADVPSDYTARQQSRRYGAFLRGRWGPVRAGVRAFRGMYQDRQTGSNFTHSLLPQPIDYEGGRRGLKGRLAYAPERGLTTGLMYAGLFRSYDAKCDAESCDVGHTFAPWTGQYWGLGPDNHGAYGLVGYRFPRGRVVLGLGLDLDGDDDFPESHPNRPPSRSYFDGGFTRLILRW